MTPPSSRKPILAFLISATVAFMAPLLAQTRGQRGTVSQDCSGTFAGTWRSPQDASAIWNITITGNSGQGDYRVPNQLRRILRGTVTDTLWRGEWFEESFDRALSGTFVANLVSPEGRIKITFYVKNTQLDAMDWFCSSGSGPGPGPRPTVTPTPPLAPTPTPKPDAGSIKDDTDIDNFQTFDSLEPAEQKKVLIRRGPRLPIEYSANDLSLRVLVRSGWPVALDYGLTGAEFAILTIQIEGFKPERIRLERGERVQIRKTLRDWRGSDVRVAKVRVESSSPEGDFRLYGFGMGQHAAEAVERGMRDIFRRTWAMNQTYTTLGSYFLPMPLPTQVGTSIGIKVNLPASLRLGRSPKERIEFSYTSNSDFSDGRWEWWRVSSTNWKKVWQKGTGDISRNTPKSQTWDGIITSAKLDSVGFHSLSISVWQKADEPEWVAARTDPTLEVIR